MLMFERLLYKTLLYASQKFPVVTLTGPRQSGKTTLVKTTFPDKDYVSLENIDTRLFAAEDPKGFLNQFKNGIIIDEAQHAPDLFSYIQTHVDHHKKMGEFILTGSQNILLSGKVSQSLAGRSAVLQLLPCTVSELKRKDDISPYSVIFKGFYPAVYDRDIDPTFYYKSYVNTYVERDLRSLINIKDLAKFRLFLQLCAGRTGQLINMSALGNECGVDHQTVAAWLSILEASYIIFLLKPHHKNFNKRLVKQPKLYFYDTGLACYLLGIESEKGASTHYAYGALFENYVMLELMKHRFNQGKDSNIYFWRDHHGKEIDCIIDYGIHLTAIEIKSAQTITSSFFDGLKYWSDLTEQKSCFLVYGGKEEQQRSLTHVLPWSNVCEVFNNHTE
jgi:predicted AAA+ superfamily ATPase